MNIAAKNVKKRTVNIEKYYVYTLAHYFLLLFLSAFIVSCDEWMADDEQLSFTRTPYDGSELKIQGYYYLDYFGGGDSLRIIDYFYSNGTYLSGSVIYKDNIQFNEIEYQNGTYYQKIKNDKMVWGLFKIAGNEIQIEKLAPTSGGSLKAYIYYGTIRNDSTFQIHTLKHSYGSELLGMDRVYHYKAFSPKPDSINSFIP
jgi:hypothetical protein